MKVVEDVIVKRTELNVKDWEKFHLKIKEIFEDYFDGVKELKLIYNEDSSELYTELLGETLMDSFTTVQVLMLLTFNIHENHAKVTYRLKGMVVTEYPEKTKFQRSLFYLAMRSLWDKLFYGWAREKYKEKCEDIVNDIDRMIKGEIPYALS